MKRKLTLRMMLAAVGLLVGLNSSWAESVILTPTADSWLNYKGSGDTYTANIALNYGSTTSLTAGIWQDMWTNATPGLKNNSYGAFAIMKFNVSDYKGKITAASFKITATNNDNSNRDLFIGYYTGTDWEEATVTASNSGINHRTTSGLNIGHLGTIANITKNSTAEYTCSSLSSLVDYLNNDADGIVSLIFYTYTKDINIASKEATTGKPTLTLTYTNETLYSATFKESNSLTPDVTVYTDAERTSAIAYNQLSANTTYYYTARLAGYNDYEGNFAVEASNPTVNFTMTALPRFTFRVNAVDAGSNILKTIYIDEDSYVGKSHNVVYPKYLTGTGNRVTYSKANNTYGENKVAKAEDETYTATYTAYDGVAYFVEIEDVVSGTAYSSWNCSNGAAVRGFTTAKNIFTVPATGVYDITYAACNNNVSYAMAVTLSKNETEISTKNDFQSISINYIKTTGIVTNENISLTSGDVIKVTPNTTNAIMDYMLVELKSVPKTITTAGWATYCSPYALDLSSATGLTDAYIVTGGKNGVLTKTSVKGGTVPANTGLLLKGTEGSAVDVTIPVVASSETNVTDNILDGVTANTEIAAEAGWVLMDDATNGLGFYQNTNAFTVGANTAYIPVADLAVPGAGARAFYSLFDSETTGVGAALVKNGIVNNEIFNLQGQRVGQPTKGLYIVGGRKVVKK